MVDVWIIKIILNIKNKKRSHCPDLYLWRTDNPAKEFLAFDAGRFFFSVLNAPHPIIAIRSAQVR